MFQQSLLGSGRAAPRSWNFAVSLLAQTFVLCAVLLATMAYTPLAPVARFAATILEPPKPPAGRTPPPEQTPVAQPERFTAVLTQPTRIPETVARIVDPETAPRIASSNLVGVVGAPDGIPDGVISSITSSVPPPRPPEPRVVEKASAAPPTAGPVSVGGAVQAAKLFHRVEPVYPQIAIQTRTSGTVRLKAIISADGVVEELSVLSGHPLLIRAAVDAVRQWRYRPTMLNGKPTPVATEIEVNFVLR